MVGKVTDIVLVLKGQSKGHGVIGFALLAPGRNGAPREMVPMWIEQTAALILRCHSYHWE